MVFSGVGMDGLFKPLYKIIDHVEWMWSRENSRSETAIANSIFAIIFLLAIILSFSIFKKEVYTFILLLLLFVFLGLSVLAIWKGESEQRKMRLYYELEKKYRN